MKTQERKKKPRIKDAISFVLGEEKTTEEEKKGKEEAEIQKRKPIPKKRIKKEEKTKEQKGTIITCIHLTPNTAELLDELFIKRYKERKKGKVSKSEIVREALLLLAKKEGIK